MNAVSVPGTCGWLRGVEQRSPQSGPICHTVTANTSRQSPRRPKTRSIVSNGIRQMTSQTRTATNGMRSR